MRTTANQILVMVSFMERHGDLARPSDRPNGRLANIQLWSELVSLLNAETPGDSRTEERWRKVWCDLKNNAKKKAGRLNREVNSTGGGHAARTRFTEIEERILAIINPLAATGLNDVPEVGLSQNNTELQLQHEHNVQQSSAAVSESGGYQCAVGEANHCGQQTISSYIEEVTQALVHPNMLKKYITFPESRDERGYIKSRFYQMYGIPGVIGCIDGSHFKIFKPEKEIEHLYYCRKHYHSLNVQMICDADTRILSINPKFGGAAHDAYIWENSEINNYMQTCHMNNEQVCICSCTAVLFSIVGSGLGESSLYIFWRDIFLD